ncbi:hypothetical protein ACFSX5_05315 [Devosia albogilva]|uniref:Uncharacterized protein n=1 Tax=Devosia albogilva TaxID=429726 RepID=A0ABW5QHH1_9HYPH
MRSWHERGVLYSFVTNNAEKSAEQFAEKLMRAGVSCTPQQVVTSADAAFAHLEARYAAGTEVFCVGSASLRERVAAHGFSLAGEGRRRCWSGWIGSSAITRWQSRCATCLPARA